MINVDDFIKDFSLIFPYQINLQPWEITNNLKNIIENLILNVDYNIQDNIAIHKSAIVEEGAIIKKPAIIGENCHVSANAYFREGIFLDNAVKNITFEKLSDWSVNENEGIRYYSGIAGYFKTFDLPAEIQNNKNTEIYLDLGAVKNVAKVKLNGSDLGVVWTSAWRVKITDLIKNKENKLEIEVANLWGNRMIGDEQFPDDGVKDRKWPEWLLENKPQTSGRFTFVPRHFYDKDSPLQSS